MVFPKVVLTANKAWKTVPPPPPPAPITWPARARARTRGTERRSVVCGPRLNLALSCVPLGHKDHLELLAVVITDK